MKFVIVIYIYNFVIGSVTCTLLRLSDNFISREFQNVAHLLYRYTGLFISSSGISELDCATTKTNTAERSISIGRESLQVSVLPAIPGSRELLTSEGP